MRRFRFFIPALLLVFAAASCQKDGEKANPDEWIDPTPGTIVGKWELYQTYGGMSPLTTYQPGNGQELHFDTTRVQLYRSGQLQWEGVYKIVNDSVTNVQTCQLQAPPSAVPNRLIYNNEVHVRNGFTATRNSLTITSGCIPLDGGASIYRKLSDTTE